MQLPQPVTSVSLMLLKQPQHLAGCCRRHGCTWCCCCNICCNRSCCRSSCCCSGCCCNACDSRVLQSTGSWVSACRNNICVAAEIAAPTQHDTCCRDVVGCQSTCMSCWQWCFVGTGTGMLAHLKTVDDGAADGQQLPVKRSDSCWCPRRDMLLVYMPV